MTDLIFYTNPQSRGRIVRWMLEEIGVPYETSVLEYATTMKAPEYLAINPMGKVPTIVHGQQVVTECAAICAYLADAFSDANLAPPMSHRGAYYRWLFFAAGPVEQAGTLHNFGIETSEEQSRSAGYGTYHQMVDVLEKAASTQAYIAGDSFTAADVYVGSQVGWGMQFGFLPRRTAFVDYFARVSDRPAYARATALDDALIKPRSD